MDTINSIHLVQIPKNVKISKNQYGYCLIATNDIQSNEIIFHEENILINDTNEDIYFKLINCEDNIIYKINNTNTVKHEDKRILYTWSGFMNHSCDTNSISIGESLNYDQVATINIKAGEEITCNYLRFDYECNSHQFVCQCGSNNCHEYIGGFKSLPLEKQIKMLDEVSKYGN